MTRSGVYYRSYSLNDNHPWDAWDAMTPEERKQIEEEYSEEAASFQREALIRANGSAP